MCFLVSSVYASVFRLPFSVFRLPSSVFASATGIQNQPGIHAVAVPRLSAEERGRIVLGPNRDKAIVAADAPPPRVPRDAAADIAGQERFGIRDAAGEVRHDGAVVGRGYYEVAAVVQKMRRRAIRGDAGELQVLRYTERAAHLSLDTDVVVQVDRNARAGVVVSEAR